jgi:cytochrome c oxidase subunit 2
MIEQLIPAGSTFAADIDFVITLIAAIVGFWYVLTQGMFMWLLWRWRDRGQDHRAKYVTGDEPELKRWVTWPHILILVCDVLIIIAAIQVWVQVKQTLPEADATIRVVGQQWAWTFQHPGPDGALDTDDDITTVDELHLQVDRTYHFKLESRDVLHSFSIPIFRLKQDAVPGRVITGWFEPTITGEYGLQCAEMCGIGHGIMGARVHVETAAEHAAWMGRNATDRVAAADPDPTTTTALAAASE